MPHPFGADVHGCAGRPEEKAGLNGGIGGFTPDVRRTEGGNQQRTLEHLDRDRPEDHRHGVEHRALARTVDPCEHCERVGEIEGNVHEAAEVSEMEMSDQHARLGASLSPQQRRSMIFGELDLCHVISSARRYCPSTT